MNFTFTHFSNILSYHAFLTVLQPLLGQKYLALGSFLWCSWLRIWHCHYSCLGHCCDLCSIPDLGTSTCHEHSQKQKRTKILLFFSEVICQLLQILKLILAFLELKISTVPYIQCSTCISYCYESLEIFLLRKVYIFMYTTKHATQVFYGPPKAHIQILLTRTMVKNPCCN